MTHDGADDARTALTDLDASDLGAFATDARLDP